MLGDGEEANGTCCGRGEENGVEVYTHKADAHTTEPKTGPWTLAHPIRVLSHQQGCPPSKDTVLEEDNLCWKTPYLYLVYKELFFGTNSRHQQDQQLRSLGCRILCGEGYCYHVLPDIHCCWWLLPRHEHSRKAMRSCKSNLAETMREEQALWGFISWTTTAWGSNELLLQHMEVGEGRHVTLWKVFSPSVMDVPSDFHAPSLNPS